MWSEHFGPEHMHIALMDNIKDVRLAAVRSNHFGPEHVDIALNDEDWEVRCAINTRHIGPEHIDAVLSHSDWYVRSKAVKSKHFGPEHMNIALNDKVWNVVIAAIESKHFDSAVLDEKLFMRLLIQASSNPCLVVRLVSTKHFKENHMDLIDLSNTDIFSAVIDKDFVTTDMIIALKRGIIPKGLK